MAACVFWARVHPDLCSSLAAIREDGMPGGRNKSIGPVQVRQHPHLHGRSIPASLNSLGVHALMADRTASSSLLWERNHEADCSSFSSASLWTENKRWEKPSTRAPSSSAQEGKSTSAHPQAPREPKRCRYSVIEVRLSQWAGWRERSGVTSAAETSIRLLRLSEGFGRAFSGASPKRSCRVSNPKQARFRSAPLFRTFSFFLD